MTQGQRWRRRRNLTLCLIALNKVSVRFAGDVFDLHPARVCRIINEVRAELRTKGGFTVANVKAEIDALSERPTWNVARRDRQRTKVRGDSEKVSATVAKGATVHAV